MKKLVKLPFIKSLSENLAQTPQFIQVILGPRQVGKTTSILHFFSKEFGHPFHAVSADEVFQNHQKWLLENWQKAQRERAILIVDEIQKIENWSEIIKRLWDEEQRRSNPISCVLLGSSSLDIHRGLTESLTGRFQLIQAHHWNVAESQEGYGINFENFLRIGGYPGSYIFSADQEKWEQYVQNSIIGTVIEKDILQNNTVKSPALFRQAFEILMSHPAQEISFTKLLGQIQDRGNVELVKHYIRLYEGAFLLKALDKFSTDRIKTRISSPKILPLCPALYSLSSRGGDLAKDRGHVFELLVGAQLVRTGLPLYYWREGNAEVDFVVKRGRHILGIEVKSGRRKSRGGIEAFLEKFPGARVVIVTPENYSEFESNPRVFMERVL